jgi:hypothetical protein
MKREERIVVIHLTERNSYGEEPMLCILAIKTTESDERLKEAIRRIDSLKSLTACYLYSEDEDLEGKVDKAFFEEVENVWEVIGWHEKIGLTAKHIFKDYDITLIEADVIEDTIY